MPGFFFAYSISSLTVFTGSFGVTSSTLVATASPLTGAKAWSQRYGGFGMVMGPSRIEALEPTNSVWPSGAERATYSPAIRPPAPGRFSMMIGWPNTSPMPDCRMRVEMSTLPPAA